MAPHPGSQTLSDTRPGQRRCIPRGPGGRGNTKNRPVIGGRTLMSVAWRDDRVRSMGETRTRAAIRVDLFVQCVFSFCITVACIVSPRADVPRCIIPCRDE